MIDGNMRLEGVFKGGVFGSKENVQRWDSVCS